MGELYALEGGRGEGAPIVLLHGVGGSHRAWRSVVPLLEEHRRVIAYDLPGHGKSVAYPRTGNAGVAAKAILADLDARGIASAHLVGHSMGGAAAALVALRASERAASLTLLAPGGFGPEINHRLLRRYAAAHEAGELTVLLEQFCGWERPLPDGMVAEAAALRAAPGQTEALVAIVETLIDGTLQRTLPVQDLGRLPLPVAVLWGEQDCVLPVRQAQGLPEGIAVEILPRVGHMLPEEIPDEVARLVLGASATAPG
ncbi:alpha/beta fold hydrolase [Faunimonas sp. B44]|uniref:alpha/beta fold hydrolase n=1 Tax=Faunimonas sp. B44 TaxID=3461493 RepID=UPI0040444CB6